MTEDVERQDSKATEDLPDGWAKVTLGDVGDWGSGGTPSRSQPAYYSGDIPWLKIADLNDGLVTSAEESISELALKNSAAKKLYPGTLLIAMYGSIGKLGITGFTCATNQAIAYCELYSSTDTEFLYWTLYYHRSNLIGLGKGGTQQNISQSVLKAYVIFLAPLPEQRRIVAEIERRFTQLDSAIADLKRVQANLKRYRASVLSAACEGRLVPTEAELAAAEGRDYEPADVLLKRILAERRARWEGAYLKKLEEQGKPKPKDDKWKAKYEEPQAPDTSELPELPEGWTRATLGQFSWDAGYGTSEKCDYNGPGVPVLRIPNIAVGQIDLADVKNALVLFDFGDGSLAVNDLLIVRTNGSKNLIGRGAVIRKPFSQPYYFASYLIRFRLIDGGVASFLSAIWHAPYVRDWIERMAATSAGQYNISMGGLSTFTLPLPPLVEQARIVAEVERRFAQMEELEAAVAAGLKQAERLRQAILRDAFSGKLVPQDPNDEPASVLLERIRAVRAEEDTAKKVAGRGRKAKEPREVVVREKKVPTTATGKRRGRPPKDALGATAQGGLGL